MANSEWDAIKLGAKMAFKARQDIKAGHFAPFIPALAFAITKDGLLDIVSAIPVAGLPTQFLGLFISVFLFVFLFGKGTWKVRLILFGLSCIDSIPILGLLPASTISVLYVWQQAKKKADQAKKELPVIQSNAQQIREYQMARARVAMEEAERLAVERSQVVANDAEYNEKKVRKVA